MIEKTKVKEMISALFEEEALVIGGLVATHEVDDDLVWSLARSFDMIRERVLNSLTETEPFAPERGSSGKSTLQPHPAIQELLRRIHENAS